MDKKQTNLIIFTLIIIAIIILIGYLFRNKEEQIIPTNFQECAEAGYPILESYPRQCITPDGKNFTESENIATTTTPIIFEPQANSIIESPLIVRGQARGFWFFEANLPISIIDENGKILAQVGAQAGSDWMTEEYVPFETELNFATTTTANGFLIVAKDNPSGLSEFDEEIRIPIKFR